MGIQGLLPFLKCLEQPGHIRLYAGTSVGIDAYSWLHKGTFSCAMELCMGQATDRYVRYCMDRIKLLKHHGVTPVVVFDGGRLQQKLGTENSRASSREANMIRGKAFLREGNKTAAMKCFQKAVDVTAEMALAFINALKAAEVSFYVAPYEADAQLAYLSMQGTIAASISEDSDLLVFGCSRVFYKMDSQGNGVEINMENFNSHMRFADWTFQKFQEMCVMAGCDYLSLSGLGMKGAYNLLRDHGSAALRNLRLMGKVTVPRDYEVSFQKALLTFRHQRVFCPKAQKLVHLTPLPPHTDISKQFPDLDFLGADKAEGIAVGIATGQLHPDTHQPLIALQGKAVRDEASEQKGHALQRSKSAPSATLVKVAKPKAKAKEVAQASVTPVKKVIRSYFLPISTAARAPYKPPKEAGAQGSDAMQDSVPAGILSRSNSTPLSRGSVGVKSSPFFSRGASGSKTSLLSPVGKPMKRASPDVAVAEPRATAISSDGAAERLSALRNRLKRAKSLTTPRLSTCPAVSAHDDENVQQPQAQPVDSESLKRLNSFKYDDRVLGRTINRLLPVNAPCNTPSPVATQRVRTPPAAFAFGQPPDMIQPDTDLLRHAGVSHVPGAVGLIAAPSADAFDIYKYDAH